LSTGFAVEGTLPRLRADQDAFGSMTPASHFFLQKLRDFRLAQLKLFRREDQTPRAAVRSDTRPPGASPGAGCDAAAATVIGLPPIPFEQAFRLELASRP
jgi:hypothetical protein